MQIIVQTNNKRLILDEDTGQILDFYDLIDPNNFDGFKGTPTVIRK